jgi:hypothetical protein
VLVKRVLFLLIAALVIAILHLISQVNLLPFVKMLPNYLKDAWLANIYDAFFHVIFIDTDLNVT